MPAETVLTSTLAIRLSPALRDRLTAAAEVGDESVGSLVRRALEGETGNVLAARLDPFAALPVGEMADHLLEAFRAQHDPDASAAFVEALADDLNGVAETAALALNLLDAEGEHRRVERLAGLLRQGSKHQLHAASRIKAMRACELAAALDAPAPAEGVRA